MINIALVYVQQEDLQYAMQESYAIIFSALASFEEKIMNMPTPTCLHGNRLSSSLWFKKVLEIGGGVVSIVNPTRRRSLSDSDLSVLVMFGKFTFCTQKIPNFIRNLCLKLSEWSNNKIVEFHFIKVPHGKWEFKDISLLPDFSAYLNPSNIEGLVKFLNIQKY